jgi:hypothetical protein
VGEGGDPLLPLLKHSLVLNKAVCANFDVSQFKHRLARERQVTYLARLQFHSLLLLIDTIVILVIPMAIPFAPCPYFIAVIAYMPFAFTPLITPVRESIEW